jgi:hypothetical protein
MSILEFVGNTERQKKLTREAIASAGALGELICNFCLKNFISPGALTNHIAVKHTPIPQRRSRSMVPILLTVMVLLLCFLKYIDSHWTGATA